MIIDEYGLHYHPLYPGVWSAYNGWRVKDWHDIRLLNGRVVKCCYPNATAWSEYHTGERFEDNEVAEVRLISDDELIVKHWGKGDYRNERNMDYFGDAAPHILGSGSALLVCPKAIAGLRKVLEAKALEPISISRYGDELFDNGIPCLMHYGRKYIMQTHTRNIRPGPDLPRELTDITHWYCSVEPVAYAITADGEHYKRVK
ncbi:hypothetical protein [Proteus columbae]|uniref:hypothetical protein n=1 Tax=Proteus columbae TaxID=1987580 RepID=UPI00288B51C3|nr:hypothetical protein [Proteus columbae]